PGFLLLLFFLSFPAFLVVIPEGNLLPGAPSSARFLRLRWASGERPTAPAHVGFTYDARTILKGRDFSPAIHALSKMWL
ncbi:hypothetical protein, partial [Granulicella sp. S156]|uniref:hypothetical protein n=1 Tax=Granulicella sp. S156 TaxID=1747224 RepID=UPI001C209A59